MMTEKQLVERVVRKTLKEFVHRPGQDRNRSVDYRELDKILKPYSLTVADSAGNSLNNCEILPSGFPLFYVGWFGSAEDFATNKARAAIYIQESAINNLSPTQLVQSISEIKNNIARIANDIKVINSIVAKWFQQRLV